jgi:glycosyltransferase involved in cell wall biosynthesis
MFTLIEHPSNRGYTRAINSGLAVSSAPYVVTLNSDTIVTPGWINALVSCLDSDPKLGIAGPLSNAASWQNVPSLLDETGNFAVNDLPNDMTPADMALIVASASKRRYPRLPFVNGFCFMMKRAVIEAVGHLDEENFPVGYGEENDYCIRAANAGFEFAIADDSYVFHAKSKSFGHERRKELSKAGSEKLRSKHTPERVSALINLVKDTSVLDEVRSEIANAMKRAATQYLADPMQIRILFLLPVKGGGGGAHSVVQETAALRSLGIEAHVAVKSADIERFHRLYSDIPASKELFVGFDSFNLVDVTSTYDVVIATIFSSASLVKRITEAHPHILPAYYVQDYEPLFFPQGTREHAIARDSYTLIPRATLFAKTQWLVDKVRKEHGISVSKVEPSIDHSTYRPASKPSDGKVHISAMIRPQTPRRGAARTMRAFARLAKQCGDMVSFHIFGCEADSPHFEALETDFPFTCYGPLSRPEVAAVLQRTHVFVDFSDYQAFGRTALEAMACGCAAIVPCHGGAHEYAVHGRNALIVDTLDDEACFSSIERLANDASLLSALRRGALATASEYSVNRAATSEWLLLIDALARHRMAHPVLAKRQLRIHPSVRDDGMPTPSGFSRLVLPYSSSAGTRRFRVSTATKDVGLLPEDPASGDVAILGGEMEHSSLPILDKWLSRWRERGGKLVFDLDSDLTDLAIIKDRGMAPEPELLVEKIVWLAGEADLVIASTEALAEKLRNFSSRVRVVRDSLDRHAWRLSNDCDHSSGPFAKVAGGPVRIGYIGTSNNDRDLDLVTSAMRQVEATFKGRVQIEVRGGFQNRKPTFGARVALPKKNDYPNFVDWLFQRVHWDIGIIPSVDDEFNRSRGHLRFLEHAALDMAIVCSDVESYRSIANARNSRAVPNNAEAWYEAVAALVEDADERLRLARAARKAVIENHITDESPTLSAVLDELLAMN